MRHPVDTGSAHVLVVDDTEPVRTVVADRLQIDGFDVVGPAAEGEQAVAMALDPHVIVMGPRKPGMNGLEADTRRTPRSADLATPPTSRDDQGVGT